MKSRYLSRRMPRVRLFRLAGIFLLAVAVLPTARAAEGDITTVGNFGPTGLDVNVEKNGYLKVLDVQPGSPAEGKFAKGEIVTAINGRVPVGPDGRDVDQLADFITAAEAADGVLTFTVKRTAAAAPREVVVKIPVLGPYSATWPEDCPKSRKIVRADADYIARAVRADLDGFTQHNLYNALAILMLLSTGEERDLAVVRDIYARRMAGFHETDTGPQNWHNGYQGIAACEYYLRTGDEAVIPLINAVCESARLYQVNGGWSHWATAVNPQYTAGGLMNPAGTQLLTTLLMAGQCGAKVDEGTLLRALKFFYRFVGHGNNPYGDHRPEGGYASDNGKSEMLAIAMGEAARAEPGGELYAMARDKNAQIPLYSFPYMLHGHTGPMGLYWYGVASALVKDQRPELYRNRLAKCRWFYELSRRFDGSFGMCGGGRYDNRQYGYGVGLTYTAPLKTLQITGAPRSKYAKSFALPPHLWGRRADRAFLRIDGGEPYGERRLLPVAEHEAIETLDEAGLERMAYHPEDGYREWTAQAIQDKGYFRLIERLLDSDDPRARETGCMAINHFNPWGLRFSKGVRSGQSIEPKDFSPAMLKSLMRMITDPREAIWNVNWALLALAVASPEQITSRLDEILPFFDNPEWWLGESACVAVAPAMQDPAALARILPPLVDCLARTPHQRQRDTMNWFIARATEGASDEVRGMVGRAFVKVYREIPSLPRAKIGMDYSGITSCALDVTLGRILGGDEEAILAGARLSVKRLGDLRDRERNLAIDGLVRAADKLDEKGQRQLGQLLVERYRPLVVGDEPAKLKAMMAARDRKAIGPMNTLLRIDQLAGRPGGWQLLGHNAQGEQTWYRASFEPPTKPPQEEMNRYREVAVPPALKDWYQVAYDPAANGWTRERAKIGDQAPTGYRRPEKWREDELPKAGEVLFIRKTFTLADLDYVMVRITAFTKQGYRVYLNGHLVSEDRNRSKTWSPRTTYLDEAAQKYLKKGVNVIAATSFLEYFRGKNGDLEVYVEGLKQFPKVD